MKRKIIKILSKEALEKLHTGTLMARRAQLLACEESLSHSDLENDPPHPRDQICFKNEQSWHEAYQDLKGVLANRENWPPSNPKNRKKGRS